MTRGLLLQVGKVTFPTMPGSGTGSARRRGATSDPPIKLISGRLWHTRTQSTIKRASCKTNQRRNSWCIPKVLFLRINQKSEKLEGIKLEISKWCKILNWTANLPLPWPNVNNDFSHKGKCLLGIWQMGSFPEFPTDLKTYSLFLIRLACEYSLAISSRSSLGAREKEKTADLILRL